jgi:hypothetical protein
MKIGRTTLHVDVPDASIRLYSFRRDSAKSSGDRIKH